MTIQNKDFLHRGLLRFWLSEGTDISGITAAWARTLRISLAHLHSAKSLDDIQGGYGKLKNIKRLTGHAHRFSMEINANWRLTFDCLDPDTGMVSKIDIEDLHRRGGARQH